MGSVLYIQSLSTNTALDQYALGRKVQHGKFYLQPKHILPAILGRISKPLSNPINIIGEFVQNNYGLCIEGQGKT